MSGTIPRFCELWLFLPSLFLSITCLLLPDSNLRESGELQTCQPRGLAKHNPKKPHPILGCETIRLNPRVSTSSGMGKDHCLVIIVSSAPADTRMLKEKHTSVTVDFQIPKWCCKVCACLIIFYARLCNTKCMLQQSVS